MIYTTPLCLLLTFHIFAHASINKPMTVDRGETYFNYITGTEKTEEQTLWERKFLNRFSSKPSYSFSWDACGPSNDSVTVTSLSVVQKEDLNFLVEGCANISVPITPPVQGELQLSKKMFWGWTSIPCLDDFGSCTYSDLCDLTPFQPDNCPDRLKNQNLPCACPIAQGTYNGSIQFNLAAVKLPKWLERGHYRAKATFGANPQLFCIDIDITIT